MRHNHEEIVFLVVHFINIVTYRIVCMIQRITDLGTQLPNPRRISQHCQGGKLPKETNGSCSLHVTDWNWTTVRPQPHSYLSRIIRGTNSVREWWFCQPQSCSEYGEEGKGREVCEEEGRREETDEERGKYCGAEGSIVRCVPLKNIECSRVVPVAWYQCARVHTSRGSLLKCLLSIPSKVRH